MSRVVIVEDAQSVGEVAADLLQALIESQPGIVLGVATGSTPLTTWAALSRRNLDLGAVSGFALDEYLGLSAEHAESYRSVVDREITGPLGIDPRRVHLPEGGSGGPARYEQAIAAAGGVDVQVLGIGRNGHIGFNEPGSSLSSPTRVVLLSEQTRLDNARFFGDVDAVPTMCVTQGIGTIRRARRLFLLASGTHKAEAVAAAVEGPVTSSVPASALQLHPDVTVVVDREAASLLHHADYYRAAWSALGPAAA